MQIIKGNPAAWVLAITLAAAGQSARAETFSINVASGSPPMGLSAHVVKSSLNDPNISLADIFLGAAPFVFGMLGVIGLLILFPQITRVFL